MEKKSVFIFGFSQESNSFNVTTATFKDFAMKDGDAWKDENNLRVKGVLQGLEEENMTPVFGPFVWSAAGAPVDDAVVDKLLGDLEKDFKKAGSIYGVAIT